MDYLIQASTYISYIDIKDDRKTKGATEEPERYKWSREKLYMPA